MKNTLYQLCNTVTLVKLLIVTCSLVFFYSAEAATLSLSPSTGVYTAGQTFTASVVINTSGASINAADGTLTYNPKEITVVNVTKGSIFNLWTADPSFSNTTGQITFSGGSPAGYVGSAGAVIKITFVANAAGSPRVSFANGSVLAADGKGTNVLTKMNSGAFTIAAQGVAASPEVIEYVAPANTPAAPAVVSSTHADQLRWYTSKTAELSWEVPSNITAIRTLLDDKASSIPTKVYETPFKSISLPDLRDGVQYFHIQFKNANGWGKVTHYRLAVDTVKPTKFDITLAQSADAANPVQTLLLKTEDETSPVSLYLVQIDGAKSYEFVDTVGSSTLGLAPLDPGKHVVIIEAFDAAGNSIIGTFSFTILAFDKPIFVEYPHEINEQVIPVIKGTTRPHAKVEVFITQLGLGVSSANATLSKEVTSNDTGEFVFIPDGKLSLGVYELTAIATDQYGARSEVSDPIKIAVQQPGYVKLGSLVVSFLSVLIPLLALTVLLVLGIWFTFRKFRSLKVGVTREAHEAHKILSQEFSNVRAQLASQKKLLETSRKTGKLTKTESELFDTLTTALKNSETRVQKEIVDVERLVD